MGTRKDSMAIKVGVIGIGYLGQHHARIFSEGEGVELVAAVDIVKEKADAAAEQFGCTAYYNYKDILNDVAAVSIVTPTPTHHADSGETRDRSESTRQPCQNRSQ
jgi:predicted dehydrogenase